MQTITQQEFEKILSEGKIIEEGGKSGIKILKMADGRFMKFFRIRNLFSSARIWPYHERFRKNALKLAQLGFSTVHVDLTARIPHVKRTVVIYQPVQGKTLRQLYANGHLDSECLAAFGAFVAGLHATGIDFNSLHLGNVILQDDKVFGLIDITDVRFYNKALSPEQRLKNIGRILRYEEDSTAIDKTGSHVFISAYCTQLDPLLAEKMKDGLSGLFRTWRLHWEANT